MVVLLVYGVPSGVCSLTVCFGCVTEDDLIYLDPHHPQATVEQTDSGMGVDVQVGWELV